MKRTAAAHLSLLMFAAIFALGSVALRADDAASPAPAASAGASDAPVTDPVQIARHYRDVLGQPQYQDVDESAVNTRVEDWLSQWFKRLGARFGEFKYATHMPAFESLLMTVLVALSLSGLLYILVRLTQRRKGMEREPDAGIPGQKIFRPPEFYDEEIQQAVRSGDWHTAWLAAWRQFLSRLEHRQLVEADRSRTNREYLVQLREKSLPSSALALLAGMVDAYDRFIYGQKPLGEPEWSFFRQQIKEAALLLHLDEKRAGSSVIRNAS